MKCGITKPRWSPGVSASMDDDEIIEEIPHEATDEPTDHSLDEETQVVLTEIKTEPIIVRVVKKTAGYDCKKCGKTFARAQALSNHNSHFHAEYKCVGCDSTFSTISKCRKHEMDMHPNAAVVVL